MIFLPCLLGRLPTTDFRNNERSVGRETNVFICLIGLLVTDCQAHANMYNLRVGVRPLGLKYHARQACEAS